jgi:hypothetical protein
METKITMALAVALFLMSPSFPLKVFALAQEMTVPAGGRGVQFPAENLHP